MITILIALVISGVVAAVLLHYASETHDDIGVIAGVAGAMLAIATGISAVSYVWAGWSWYASGYKAEIINREYGTKYTREEIFYASDVIDTIREIDRKRIEVNGDVIRGRDGEK